ncbi:uncharacterized protein LOC123405108 [Hordeum vulgare subsp. vulgare]|uniref:uncharacterized protein LOC123405108 n=1 Tax=Hordeum vulgare subsp. vulgare TaxID=112509 RepID=UPI001D1A4034|nr:uncharacterized protein LOC123405108 [Hordeum vulgare subsp. vulgare]
MVVEKGFRSLCSPLTECMEAISEVEEGNLRVEVRRARMAIVSPLYIHHLHVTLEAQGCRLKLIENAAASIPLELLADIHDRLCFLDRIAFAAALSASCDDGVLFRASGRTRHGSSCPARPRRPSSSSSSRTGARPLPRASRPLPRVGRHGRRPGPDLLRCQPRQVPASSTRSRTSPPSSLPFRESSKGGSDLNYTAP